MSYADIFIRALPNYLALGMSADEFWNGDVDLCKAYLEASKIEANRTNYEAWLQGLYVYTALCDVAPLFHAFAPKGTKAHKYPQYPYGQEKVETDDARQKRLLDACKEWAEQVNAKYGSENG